MTVRLRVEENPFHVLELPPSCSRIEAERQGQKLLGMLELGIDAARSYRTPLGRRQRSAEDVRQALAELRDPRRRLSHELWYVEPDGAALELVASTPDDETEAAGGTRRWQGALARHRWRRR